MRSERDIRDMLSDCKAEHDSTKFQAVEDMLRNYTSCLKWVLGE